MIRKINHIGIAVHALEESVPFYRDVLGLEYLGEEEVPEQKVKVAMFQVGEVKIELLEPATEDSPVAKHLEKKGEGIHHIAYETDEVVDAIDELREKGIELIDKKPREGAHCMKIAFLHPKSTGKVLTEICSCEDPEDGE
jgi:methylmalonyl-CoA/ethylmalonyl-CoA epimerase